MNTKSIIFHIDANSAYLSWTAVDMLESGSSLDIRTIPSAICGNPKNRHGIILTKSIPAKKFRIQTGESIYEARKKCPTLRLFAPNYDLYTNCSDAFFEILTRYSPLVQRYSIDECFLDYSASQKLFGGPIETAHAIREAVKDELGFTVNIGISTNKILAKMGSELKKPDMVHTLFTNEIEEKMWPLPIGELFFVGRATKKKLLNVGINTIGDIANYPLPKLQAILHNVHGQTVWNFANGIDYSEVKLNESMDQKGVGNSTTIGYDVSTRKDAREVLLALTEKVGMRLRKLKSYASVISVHVRPSDFDKKSYGHQRKLWCATNSTSEIYDEACRLFDEIWEGESIRKLGVHVGQLTQINNRQVSLFDQGDPIQIEKLDFAVDEIREKYGKRAIERGVFVNSDISPIQGGVREEEYLMMGGHTS